MLHVNTQCNIILLVSHLFENQSGSPDHIIRTDRHKRTLPHTEIYKSQDKKHTPPKKKKKNKKRERESAHAANRSKLLYLFFLLLSLSFFPKKEKSDAKRINYEGKKIQRLGLEETNYHDRQSYRIKGT